MKINPPKPRKCRHCGDMTTNRPIFCCWKCKKAYTKAKKKRIKANTPVKGKKRSELVLELQDVFNKYIRTVRDKYESCISCGCTYATWNAGHYKTVGAHPELRINEDNCHKQCEYCNITLDGNATNYKERLPKRIGQERFEALEFKPYSPLKLSVSELLELIEHYERLSQ